MRVFRNMVMISIGLVLAVALGGYFLASRAINWNANQKPSPIEAVVANHILLSWVRQHAPRERNPLSPSHDNLKSAQSEFEEHCASCHGLDGSGKNRFEADFYPPVPKLTGDILDLSDGELYFIVAKGIRNTAMPSFEQEHSADDMWKMVLWIRHLELLSPEEKAALEKEIEHGAEQHAQIMDHGRDHASAPHDHTHH